jgi:nucleoside-diphosphate-sugar epimerase
MKKKVLIIGKNSFIGNSLVFFLNKKFSVKKKNFDDFMNLSQVTLNKFDYIINCAINHKYVNKRYLKTNDFDNHIVQKIKDLNCKFIFISTRKIYKSGRNLKENSRTQPKCNYSKNKLITEKKIVKLSNDKILILRISNLIGHQQKTRSNRKIHFTFIDHFFESVKKGLIFDNKKTYKDFISTKTFSEIVEKLIKNNSIGIFNVSIGQKVYLNELVKWLNYYNKRRCVVVKTPNYYNKDCFFLNNNRLKERIKIKITLSDLEKYCKNLSKNYFLK